MLSITKKTSTGEVCVDLRVKCNTILYISEAVVCVGIIKDFLANVGNDRENLFYYDNKFWYRFLFVLCAWIYCVFTKTAVCTLLLYILKIIKVITTLPYNFITWIWKEEENYTEDH